MDYQREYQLFKNDTQSAHFPEFTTIIDLWRSKSKEGEAPCWADFEFEDFTGWHGRISLGELIAPKEVLMILWGTKLTDWWGFDYTQKRLGQWKNTTTTWEQAESNYLDLLFETGSIGAWHGNLESVGRAHCHIKCIDLPLSKDGKTTHLMSAYTQFDPDEKITNIAIATHTFIMDL